MEAGVTVVATEILELLDVLYSRRRICSRDRIDCMDFGVNICI